MLEKVKNYVVSHTLLEKLKMYVLSLRDPRNVGSLAFVVLVLLITWSGVKAVQTNYTLQQHIDQLSQENAVAHLKNENQKLQNEYYTTSQYLELTARQNFGLAAPGETELLVPKEVALAHTVPMPDATEATGGYAKKAPWRQNFEEWINFFLHREG